MGDWLAKRCTRAADAVMVSAGIMAGLLGTLWLFGAFAVRPEQAATTACQRATSTLEEHDCFEANLARVARAERRAADTLGPVDMNAMAYPQEDAQP